MDDNPPIDQICFNEDIVGDEIEDLWREIMTPFFQVEPGRSKGSQKKNYINVYSLDNIVCIDQQFNASRFIRDRKRISSFDNDCIGLCLWLDGKNNVDNAGSSISVNNAAFLMDMGKPVTSQASDSRCLSLALPKPLLAEYGLNINKLGGLSLDSRDPRFSILRGALLGTFQALPYTGQAQSETIANALGALIGGLFSGADFVVSTNAVEAAAHHAVLDYIQQNLANPKLDVAMISKALPYSRSTLYRQFSPEGGIAQYIRSERLKCCYIDIASPLNRSRSVSAIANSWGFTNASHFSRLFKQYFGLSPSDAQEAENNDHSQNAAANEPKDKVKQVINWFSHI